MLKFTNQEKTAATFNGSSFVLASAEDLGSIGDGPTREAVLAWLALGNTPLPADPPTPQQILSEIEAAITAHMDSVAKSKRYDNRDSCRLYAGYPNAYQAEAIAYGQWVASCWVVSNTAQADIIAGLRTIPTPTEAVAELPVMVWPV